MVKKIAILISVLLLPVMALAAPPWADGDKKNSDWKAEKQQQKYEKKRAHEEAKKNRKYEHEEYKKDFRSDRDEWLREKDRGRADRDDRDDRDYRDYRDDRPDYESGTSTDEVMDTAIDSVMPEDMKDSPASDVIKQEAKKWWER